MAKLTSENGSFGIINGKVHGTGLSKEEFLCECHDRLHEVVKGIRVEKENDKTFIVYGGYKEEIAFVFNKWDEKLTMIIGGPNGKCKEVDCVIDDYDVTTDEEIFDD